jgi:aminoglycoside phosphotransferase family enzyme
MKDQRRTADRNDQAEVIAFLADPSSYTDVNEVERFETHRNLVFLAGSDACKIKRAICFSYMDLSTLEKRAAACVREMEVNHRLAPELYLGCVPITRAGRRPLVPIGQRVRIVCMAAQHAGAAALPKEAQED